MKKTMATVHGVHILECLETNMEPNGWWTLTQNTKEKSNT